MPLTIRQLKYFVAAAELGQISQAAIQLAISQSAITTSIRDLENSIGTQLFERSARGVVLTHSGRNFLNHAYIILSSVDAALSMHNLESTVTGRVTLGASYTVISYLLPYHLKRLAQIYPHIEIQVDELKRDSIEEGLLAGRYDMGVLLTSNVMNPSLAVEPFFASARRLWVESQHPLLELDSVSLEDVAREPYIMLTVDEAAETSILYWNETAYQPNIRLRTSSVEAVRSMVANGSGVAILSDMVYRPWSLEGRRIETIHLRDHIPAMSVGMAWQKGRKIQPAMHAVREYFRRTFDAALSGC